MNPLGEFSRQPLILGLDFHLIFIFYLHRALCKIHTWKFFVYRNIIARGKIKCREKSLGEKKGPKKKEMVPFCQEKKKNSFVKAVGTGGAPRWRPDLELRSRRQTNICHTWWSLLCRRPQRFTERWGGRHVTHRCSRWVTFPGKSWFILIDAGRFPCSIGLRKTNRGREDLLAWRELLANLYELKSRN